jgi:hypothetical protein
VEGAPKEALFCNVDLGGLVPATLDALATALYVQIDDFLLSQEDLRPDRSRGGRPARISDAELITLAVCQMFLGITSDRRFLALAGHRLRQLFPDLPKQPGYNKRLRALAPQIGRCITHLALVSPSFCDGLRLLDSTPVPCGQSRETVKRSELAGYAAYGYCASHSRHFWGFRLYLLCASDGMPIRFELAPANAGEREVAAEMLHGLDLDGYTVIADKGFAGEEFEQFMASLHARFLRPDRQGEPVRFGALGGVRQWVESIINTLKDTFSLERHGGRTTQGVGTRLGLRLLALAAGLWHNWQIGNPGRHLTAYTH